jgi:hypothetical protein
MIIRDDDRQCKTALTRGVCNVGTHVLVYYDRSNLARTVLNEYGAESRSDIHLGAWMTPTGIGLLLFFFVNLHVWRRRHPEDNADDPPIEREFDPLHIVPKDEA